MNDYNPIPFDLTITTLAMCFSDDFVDKIKNELKNREFESNTAQYHSDKEIFVEIDYKWSEYGESELYNKISHLSEIVLVEISKANEPLKSLFSKLILNPDPLFAFNRTTELEAGLIEMDRKIPSLKQSTAVVRVFESVILELQTGILRVYSILKLDQPPQHSEYWRKNTVLSVKILQFNPSSKISLQSIADILIPDSIFPESRSILTQIFSETGKFFEPVKRVTWVNRNTKNGKGDNASIAALIYLLLKFEVIIQNWQTDSELSTLIQGLFCDTDGKPIRLRNAGISLNKYCGDDKFPKLLDLLKKLTN